MTFAIVTYLDPATEAEVRVLWELLSEKGISSAMSTMGVRPHITLMCTEGLEVSSFCQELKAFARGTSPRTIRFGAVGTFSTDQGVVYLAPTVTRELLTLHEAFHDRLASLGLSTHEYYYPGNWIPHCTAAINLPPESISAAVEVCRQRNVTHAVQLTQIGLVEYLPVQEICVFPFGGTIDVEPH